MTLHPSTATVPRDTLTYRKHNVKMHCQLACAKDSKHKNTVIKLSFSGELGHALSGRNPELSWPNDTMPTSHPFNPAKRCHMAQLRKARLFVIIVIPGGPNTGLLGGLGARLQESLLHDRLEQGPHVL